MKPTTRDPGKSIKRSERSRPTRKLWAALGVIAAVGLSCATAAPALATTYSITDLGNLGLEYAVAKAINNNDQITGYSATSKAIQVPCPPQKYGQPKKCFEHPVNAFLWEAGTMTDLGTLGGNDSQGFDINNLGEVVGTTQTKSGLSESFLFRNGRMTGLGSFGASAINDLGVIAGTSPVPSPIPGETRSDAAILQNGKVTDLGSLPTVGVAVASDINNSDEVIGTGGTSPDLALTTAPRTGRGAEMSDWA